MRKRTAKRLAVWGAIGFCALVLLAVFVYRPWAINWGATDDEISRNMLGDDMLQNPTFSATRAVTIKAQPEEIWPWIVQYGYKRAGMYCYDWFDNDGIPSANRIMPEHQNLKVGDLMPLSAFLDVEVVELEPNRSMLWVFPEYSGPWSNSTWAWELHRKDAQHTRLITRLRVRTDSAISRIMLDFFEIVMMRKSMLGIKRRAEGLAESSKPVVPDGT